MILRPVSENPSGRTRHNKSGLAVLLTTGEGDDFARQEHEMCRVGFARQHSRNPDVPFEEQLQAELAKAQEACEALNEAMDAWERDRTEELVKARATIRELLGPPKTGKPV